MGLDDPAHQRQTEAGALRLGRAQQGREGPGLLLFGHAQPGVGKLDGHLCPDLAPALHEVRRDGQRAAFGHRLDGVECQVEKHLFQLDRVGHHEWQISTELPPQRDAVIGEFVPRQQAKILDDLIYIHRRGFGFRAAREVEDLLHDLVQQLHLVAHDPYILGPRIAPRKLQVERVEQHLHHRQRIADLMRDFGGEQAEGAQLFRLPQLFLDIDNAFVEPGLLDRNG